MKQNIEDIYTEYAPELFKICLRYASSNAEAEDILHDGFVRIIEHLEQYKGKGSFEGWLKRVVVSVALNKMRTNKYTPTHYKSFDEINEADISDNSVVEAEDRAKLLDAELTQNEIVECLQQIPTKARVIFNLYVFEQKKHKQIAKELDITISTSKTQLKRARTLLHKQLMSRADMKLKKLKKLGFFALFVRKDSFSYIDNLVKSTIEEAVVTPPKPNVASMFDKANVGQTAIGVSYTASSGLSQIIGHVKSHIVTYTIAAALTVGVSLYVVNHQSTIEQQNVDFLNPRTHQNLAPLDFDHFLKESLDSYEIKNVEAEPKFDKEPILTDTISIIKKIRVPEKE